MLAPRIRRMIRAKSGKREEVKNIKKVLIERAIRIGILEFNREISFWESISSEKGQKERKGLSYSYGQHD